MVESLTLSLSGTSSLLETYYFPPIELDKNATYVLGLVELLTFNSIPNIDYGHNKFKVGEKEIELPTGTYEIGDIERYVKEHLASSPEIEITIKPNNNTLCSEITCNRAIDFRLPHSIARLLGFTRRELEANKTHVSDMPVAILKVNALRVECNITSGAYVNQYKGHNIHEFFPAVPPGYKIIEVPKQIIYLPLSVKVIDHLQLRLVDQDGDLINLRGEVITIRLHIKRVS